MSFNYTKTIIVGAGLSGLACALFLQRKKIDYLIIEQSNSVGGRVSSETTNDFIFDHGFQVLIDSYPEIKNVFDFQKLDMRYLNSGCYIYTPQGMKILANPVLHPSKLLSETLSNFISLKDKGLVVSLILKSHLNANHDSSQTALSYLADFGFSDHFIENFWKPFFSGVCLDENLQISAGYFLFLIKCFSVGLVGVPAAGMNQLAVNILNQLDRKKVLLNTKVEDYGENYVKLSDGQVLNANHVCLSINPEPQNQTFNSVENLYFSTSYDLDWGKWLIVVPPSLGMAINNIAVMSNISNLYSVDKARHLISVSVLGNRFKDIETVANELRIVAGHKLEDLKLVKHYSVKKALPKVFGSADGFVNKNGVFYFGDWATTPSINGAIESGRKLAEKISAKAN